MLYTHKKQPVGGAVTHVISRRETTPSSSEWGLLSKFLFSVYTESNFPAWDTGVTNLLCNMPKEPVTSH